MSRNDEFIARYPRIEGFAEDLPLLAKYAILAQDAICFSPNCYERRLEESFLKDHGGEIWGVASIPVRDLADELMRGFPRHASFAEFSREYRREWEEALGEPYPRYEEIWPIVLSTYLDWMIEDGNHRFHSYYSQGLKRVPAIYRY